MADLAERVDDLICTFEGGGETTMDTVAMLIFGWMVFGLFVLAIGKYIYQRFVGGLPEDAKPVIEDISAVTIPTVSVEDGAVVVKPVPPTPPVRRRPVPKKVSPGPAPLPTASKGGLQKAGSLNSHLNHHARQGLQLLNAPQATGPDGDSVRWVNRVFQWLYCDLTAVQEVINTWILNLNEFTKKSVTEHGVGVEFVRVLPESHSPTLSSVFSECAPNEDVTITCDFEATPALQLKAFRQKGEKVEVSHYRVNVNRLRARLNLSVLTEKLLVDAKFDGWPDIKVALAQVGSIRNSLGSDEAAMQEVINDIVVTAIRSSSIHLNFSKYNACPRFDRYMAPATPVLPVHYDSMSNHTRAAAEKRLLVKIVKAANLGSDKGCVEPYCVVEMDEPAQKFSTTFRSNTNSPIWDEHFKFELSPNTMELMFEIYDRSDHRFLGLGIVGVEELLASPSQRQVILLQPRPYETDQVSGSLTVEFMFVDINDGPLIGRRGEMPLKLKETVKSVSPTGAVITTTKTVYSKGKKLFYLQFCVLIRKILDGVANGVDGLADSALRELELRNARTGANTQASKSTLIIHSVQRQTPQRPVVKVELTEGGQWHEVPEIVQPEQGTREEAELHDGEATNGVNATLPDERGRTKKKKRDFFGTIKKRLSRSKNRSKSVDPSLRDESLGRDASLNRSVSADRARDASASDPNRSVTVPKGLDGSTRSSLSEASGISGASTRTYVNDASTLVLETIENGVKKHYLVPLSLAQRSKWRKKGVKLHIYNDHTFVARHLPGGTVCTVCTKSVARRIGKQGYECRDCLLRCHKHCHVKADTTCPNSTIQSIELQVMQNSPLGPSKLATMSS
ncbi:uncharacterized protein LOC132201927 isoform X2 [Neocloeon triangulifer]|uniref:uncharacterized protein LOC132201927 isoform X2 n=1 Tax=Neocloeon triangulifer TaxID=2078957 RepID=UPI00286ED1AF|nr:uncharacterized protein LOC132201927 isoform X2 [Neocloeon triangulifer]